MFFQLYQSRQYVPGLSYTGDAGRLGGAAAYGRGLSCPLLLAHALRQLEAVGRVVTSINVCSPGGYRVSGY